MTDQADTPDPIGAREQEIANEARIMGTRDGIDALAGSIGRSLAAAEATSSRRRAAEVRALRAENERLTDCLTEVRAEAEQIRESRQTYWTALLTAADERDAALAELAAARDREAAVRALHRPRVIDVCMDEDEHAGDRCDCGTKQTVCAGCFRTFFDLHEPWMDNPIPAEIIWPCPTVAALSQSEPTKETP